MSLGHLPGFVNHRNEVAADPAGFPATVNKLRCRGYEKILLKIDTDHATPGAGTADLELYQVDADGNSYSVWTQAGATETTLYEVNVYGGDVVVAVRNFSGGVTKVSVFAAGAVPERAFGN